MTRAAAVTPQSWVATGLALATAGVLVLAPVTASTPAGAVLRDIALTGSVAQVQDIESLFSGIFGGGNSSSGGLGGVETDLQDVVKELLPGSGSGPDAGDGLGGLTGELQSLMTSLMQDISGTTGADTGALGEVTSELHTLLSGVFGENSVGSAGGLAGLGGDLSNAVQGVFGGGASADSAGSGASAGLSALTATIQQLFTAWTPILTNLGDDVEKFFTLVSTNDVGDAFQGLQATLTNAFEAPFSVHDVAGGPLAELLAMKEAVGTALVWDSGVPVDGGSALTDPFGDLNLGELNLSELNLGDFNPGDLNLGDLDLSSLLDGSELNSLFSVLADTPSTLISELGSLF